MRSRELDLSRYDTDKIGNRYLEHYDPLMTPLAGQAVKLLEIGVYKGGSLLLWRDYFPRGTIVGIDAKLPAGMVSGDRIHLFEGSQADTAFLSRVAGATAPDGFDIIIDDASHVGELTRRAFWHLFDRHLKPGGLYIIEDWGTGYWDDWPDGSSAAPSEPWLLRLCSRLRFRGARRDKRPWPCHSHGMVGLVKELVDEQGARDMTRRNLGAPPGRPSRFESMLVAHGLVVVKKSSLPQPSRELARPIDPD